MKTLGITCFILHSLIAHSAAQLERLEAVECKPNEFYYGPREACKSCSDLRILFYGRDQEEWSNSDAINLSKPGIAPDADRRQLSGSKSAPEVEPSRFSSAGKEVLSRLIGMDGYFQEGAQRYSVAQESGAAVTSSDDDEEQSATVSSEATNPLTQDTLVSERFVDEFIASQLVRDELLQSIEQCKYFQNSTACQLWSNLCVMTLYSQSSNLAALARARSNNQLRRTSGQRSMRRDEEAPGGDAGGGGQWWQQCSQEFNRHTICDSLRSWWRFGGSSISHDISNIFPSSDEEGLSIKIAGSNPLFKLNQPIQLLAYKYSLHGKFIGVDQFGVSQMEKFCFLSGGSPAKFSQLDNNFIRVGRNMKATCRFNTLQAQQLVAGGTTNDTVFVDLYMAHQLNGAVFVKPVPVLIRNLLYNRMLINQHRYTDTSRLRVVHRFFLSSLVKLGAGGEQMLVYPKSASLDLKFKSHERSAQLISMVLVLDYGQVPLKAASKANHKNSTSPLSYNLLELKTDITISQTLADMARHKMDFELTLTILSIVSCIWSLLKSYNILRYHGMVKMDVYSLIRFLFVSCDTLANLIATCTLLFTGFLFLAFKTQQNSIHVLAPGDELDESILTNIKLALAFKVIGLSYKMFDLLNVDVFFVDWERPKMLTSAEIQNHLSHYSKHQDAAASLKNNTLDSRLMGDQHKELSFWRSYAVVERWLQLQTMRRQSIALQLILFTCLNEVLGFTELARTEPEWSLWRTRNGSKAPLDTEPELVATLSSSYRLLIHAIVYLIIALAQVVWHKYFYETMIRDKVHEFIDLCSIGNVSLFCMLYPRFGYYVHGRNANGSGDCGICEMNGLLEREERGLCSRRGLVPNTDDQVFVLILPRLINDHYRKLLYQYQNQQILSSMFNNSNRAKSNADHARDHLEGDLFEGNFFRSAVSMSNWAPRMASSGSNRALIESIVNRKRVINVFLTNFLEHHYKDIDYSITEWRRFESFLSEPELGGEMVTRGNGLLTPRAPPAVIIDPPEAALASTKPTPAILCRDPSNSFTSLLWLGLEWDLCLMELLSLLVLDHWLEQSLFISGIILYSLHWLLRRLYQIMARKNLVFKSLVDDKFLLKS